jgi:hypothetical protein
MSGSSSAAPDDMPIGSALPCRRHETEGIAMLETPLAAAAVPAFPRAFVRRVPPVRADGFAGRSIVRESDLDGLPVAAQRYLRFMGVPGRPPAQALWARCTGSFRRGRNAPERRCRTWQYNQATPVLRLFRMRLRLGPLAMTGWDTYQHGRGRMRGTVLGVPVVDGHGATFDTSEQVTWLNDAVLMAPSMLLHPAVRWLDGTEARSFVLEFTDAGRTVRAEVWTDHRGAPLTFVTDDRYADLPGGPARARWSTPVDGWTVRSGRPLFTRASAVWQLPDGPFRYATLTPTDVIVRP